VLWCDARENGLSNLRSWRKNAGAKSDVSTGSELTLTTGAKVGLFDSDRNADEPYWVRVGITDTADNFFEMYKDANSKDVCKNCTLPGHSIAWCSAERRKDLLCQLCMC